MYRAQWGRLESFVVHGPAIFLYVMRQDNRIVYRAQFGRFRVFFDAMLGRTGRIRGNHIGWLAIRPLHFIKQYNEYLSQYLQKES